MQPAIPHKSSVGVGVVVVHVSVVVVVVFVGSEVLLLLFNDAPSAMVPSSSLTVVLFFPLSNALCNDTDAGALPLSLVSAKPPLPNRATVGGKIERDSSSFDSTDGGSSVRIL